MGCLILFSPKGSAVGLDIECLNLFSPEGSAVGLDIECLNLFSPEGRWLGWIWNALICSVLTVGG
jgi:hypothetical protein